MYICTYEYVSIHIYIYMCVLCFVFCVLGCLLVDLNVMCVYKILLFLWFWLCFCICMSIYMCSSVLIWGWDRVVLGMCLFRAGADILVVGVWGQKHRNTIFNSTVSLLTKVSILALSSWGPAVYQTICMNVCGY